MAGCCSLLLLSIIGVFITLDDVIGEQDSCNNDETIKEILDAQKKMFEGLTQQITNLTHEVTELKEWLFPHLYTTPETYPENDTWRDCADVYNHGYNTSGVYTLSVQNMPSPIQVYCNMDHGGGWTVFQARFNSTPSFYRTWDEYKRGFGDIAGNHWLGNDILAAMTEQDPDGYKLRVQADPNNGWRTRSDTFTNFRILNESQYYQLQIDTRSWDDEGFSINNGMNFTTKDRDNDGYFKNCAKSNYGAWWFTRQCGYTHLNGPYPTKHSDGDIFWYPFNEFEPCSRTLMMFRPMTF